MGAPARLISTRILQAVLTQGNSLDDALARHLPDAEAGDRPFIQAQCYGCLRDFEALAAVAGMLLSRPLKRRDQDIYCLLLAGVYELWHMHTPAHACLAETVQVSTALNKAWAKGLVNAVLRRAQRERAQLERRLQDNEVSRYCLPAWLLERIRQDWPQRWQDIAVNLHQPAPMTLRINLRRLRREEYLQELAQRGLDARAHPWVESAVQLGRPVEVGQLPGFEQGWFSVQDAAAQLAAPLLAPAAGERVLDACAAPGGKTAHLAEYQPDVSELWALDIDAQRLPRVHDNLDRLGLAAQVRQGDAAQPAQWWDGQPFDRILLDAPCSATGVIRRHPDIKRLRRASDIDSLGRRQRALLEALWSTLAPGGMLLYATCSLIRAENNECIAAFVAAQPDARHQPLSLGGGVPCDYGYQLVPGDDDMDGFYYAALLKQDS